MKKLQLLFTSLLLILLLAACGTAEDQNAEPDNTDQETEEETNNIEDESAKENGTQQEENANQNENQIQYTSNNETRTAETANVEEDLYTIQIMEGKHCEIRRFVTHFHFISQQCHRVIFKCYLSH